MANITNELEKIKSAVYGNEVRQSIHDAIKTCYDDAAISGNANMEVTLARGTYNTLNDRLEKNDIKFKEVDEQFNTIKSEKADEVDVQVLSERMNQFTSLQQGSTTGDAELIDGRISADGITYTNIGDSIRTQISSLSDLKQVENIPLLIDGYINSSGWDESLGTYKKSEYVKVNKGDIVQVNSQGYNSNVSVIHLYNNNKKPIKSLQIGNNSMVKYTHLVPCDGYIRVCSLSDKKMFAKISRVNSAFTELNNNYENSFKLGFEYTWTKGSYIKYDTGVITKFSDDYSYSNLIDISMFKGLYVYITEYYDYVSGIAFYDENEKYIKGYKIDNNDNLGQITEYKLEGHYIRLTCRTDKTIDFKLYTTITQIAKSISYEEEINPCFYKDNSNNIKLFNKILCVGDSYTQGSIEYKLSTGETRQAIAENYCYPKQLSKIANVEIVNLGHAGYTSQAWYNKYKDTPLTGYDCAIVFLGINDWYNGGVLKEEYTQIITKLRNENKNIPIFCVTIPSNYKGTACNLNDSIRTVATENNCYIIDIETYGDFHNTKFANGGHLNSYGYFHLAEMINSCINYIIETNKNDFLNLSFVGTDRIDF